MPIKSFRITRFQFMRDRIIGDSQVRANDVNVATIELISDSGQVGLGFLQALFNPLPDQAEIERLFLEEVWPAVDGAEPLGLAHAVRRPRGGKRRASSLAFGDALQMAVWDLAAKEAGLPLWKMLGAQRDKVRAYASGLDFHLDDEAFSAFFAHADSIGYDTFKIKVGHKDFERDLHRLELLKKCVRKGAGVMIDPNEAWSAKEAAMKIEKIRAAGHDLIWVEDPILRDDFDGLRMLRHALPHTQINSGEYLDASGKVRLMMAGAVDILNVHAQIGDVMRVGWLAAELGIPVSLGNTFLELGVNMACALPEVEWLEYSFQNFDHLVEQPIEIRDGWIYGADRPGHGLALSEEARRQAVPRCLQHSDLGVAPHNPRTAQPKNLTAV